MGISRFGRSERLNKLFRAEGEGGGEQSGEGSRDDVTGGGGIEDGGFGGGELGDGLAAGSARHAGCPVEVDDGDGADADCGAEEGNGGSDGGLLGAGGKAVGGVFDVGSGDYLPGFEQESAANAEAAVGRVGVLGGLGGALVQQFDFGRRERDGRRLWWDWLGGVRHGI